MNKYKAINKTCKKLKKKMLKEGIKFSFLQIKHMEEKVKEAENLRNHCKELLKKEKEEIIKTAKENNIPLEEIGISEDDDDDDFDDFDEDEEEEEEDEEEEKKEK